MKRFAIANIRNLALVSSILLGYFWLFTVKAQKADTLQIKVDSLRDLRNNLQDTLPKRTKNSSEIRTTIRFQAKDSVKIQIKKKKAAMYEKAQIDYGETQLKSAKIYVDLNTQIVKARPNWDTLRKNRLIDKPILKEKDDEFVMDSVDYNLETQKGLIYNIVTKQGEGFVAGKRVKKDAENELCIKDGHYTTCNLANPHFRIVARKIKVTKKQNVISGPFYMEVGGVPTPLGFAFGIFPKPQEKVSGIIIPEYGESRENGFFLRGGGYYWAISDYVDATLTTEFYTYGNWGFAVTSNYKKRYAFNGGFNFSYRSLWDRPLDEFNRNKTGQFSLTWNHRPETKGTGNFSASANIASARFNQTSVTNINQLITTNLNSSITYSKTFRRLPFALSLAGRHQQDLQRNLVTINLPDFNFTMNQIFPLKGVVRNPKSFLATLGINYSLTANNTITNQIIGTGSLGFETTRRRKDSIYAFRPENFSLFLQNTRINITHSSQLSVPFKVLRYFNGSFGFNISQTFHQRRFSYTWQETLDPQTNTIRGAMQVDTIRRWGSTYRYNFSLGFSTNIYGFFNFPNAKKRLQAIRHTILPNVSVSYSPDFSRPQFGFYQRNVQVGYKPVNIGTGQTVVLPLYRDLPIFEGSPGQGASGNVGINIRNKIEAKVLPKNDTSSKAKPQVISLVDEIGLSTSYNMLADPAKSQHAWSNVNINTRVRLLNRLDIGLSASLDPYLYRDTLVGNQLRREKTFELAWSKGELGRITSANLSFSTALNPDFFKKKTVATSTSDREGMPSSLLNPMGNTQGLQTSTVQNPLASINRYVDFDVTWNLVLNYNLSYSFAQVQQNFTQTFNFSGDISLTKNWKLVFNSSYDFRAKGFGPSQFSFTRDLHCWQMSFDWQPFGQFQSYFFRFNANASTLRDLKVERRRTTYDR